MIDNAINIGALAAGDDLLQRLAEVHLGFESRPAIP